MLRTRAAAWRMPNKNFNNRRFTAARVAMDNRNRRGDVLLLPQGRDVEVKHGGRRTRVYRKAIFPTAVRERRYPTN